MFSKITENALHDLNANFDLEPLFRGHLSKFVKCIEFDFF